MFWLVYVLSTSQAEVPLNQSNTPPSAFSSHTPLSTFKMAQPRPAVTPSTRVGIFRSQRRRHGCALICTLNDVLSFFLSKKKKPDYLLCLQKNTGNILQNIKSNDYLKKALFNYRESSQYSQHCFILHFEKAYNADNFFIKIPNIVFYQDHFIMQLYHSSIILKCIKNHLMSQSRKFFRPPTPFLLWDITKVIGE